MTQSSLPPHRSPSGIEAKGLPADGIADQGALEPIGREGRRHWKQASLSDTSLDDRSDIFFAAVQMTRMPMILADPRQSDCPIVFANNAFLDLTGYEEGEVLGRNCRFLQGAGTDPEAVSELRSAIAERRAVAVELLNYRRDATAFWNAVFMGPVFDDDGNLIYFFASQLDVTARRESEQALRQAQKMEAIGQLTAGLGHDFNNLLQILNGCLERMQSKRHDQAAFDRLHAGALAATQRGAKLTQQLLTFARRTRLEPQGVDLSTLINSFGDLLESSVGNTARLNFDLQRRLPLVRVDPNHLEMALLNIVVNARDASTTGGEITVATRALHLNGDAAARHLPSGDYVSLSVTDQGEGMAPHVRARAMEPFFTTKGAGKGTGLGLAMAHGFVQQSGGRLEIESEQGRGTVIRMLFPQLDEKPEASQPRRASGYPTQPLAHLSAAPLILVVDDSVEVAEFAAESLADVGYRVIVSHSAEEAFEQFKRVHDSGDPVHLVFTDILMPGGANGLVLADWILGHKPTANILLTTGYSEELALNGPQASPLEVLGKPYKRSELIDRVQAALRSGARTGPGRRRSDFGHVEA